MTGKAYTMKEMKGIVNYIVDHKTYGEIRGRKMWMDYAKSKETTRTWQSLKETFLKRILPDIHNPYYGLQLTQIASFRQGSDVEANNSNKLNVEPVDKGPGSPATSGENGHDRIEKDVENNKDQNKEQNTSGEDPNIDELDNVRASTETHILDPCYGSADDIRKDLEQSDQERALDPKGEAPVATAVVPNNTVKVNSSDEENIDTLTKAVQKAADQQQEIAIELSDSEENQVKQNGQADNMEAKAAQKEETNLNIPTEKEKDKENSINTSKSILSGNEVTSEKIKSTKNIKDTPNNSNTIDTQLPNNPEELDKSKENNKEVAEPKRNKKRAASQEMIISKRKKLLNKQSASDTDAIKHISKNVIPEDPSEKQDEPISHDGQVINLETLSDTNEANVRTNELEVILEKNPENPYSKSVKVHEEQYSCTINSESDNVEITKEPKKTVKPKKPVPIPVTSISNLSSTTDNPGENIPKLGIVRKKQRDNALGHAFGFSTGEVSRNNKRRHSYTKKRVLHPTLNISSDTSDASSMSDSDFISPPRGKKHKGHTKYVKPKSLRMRTLDEDGGLFVMQGKRIFPFVTDGKNLKKFLSYEPDDSDEESYWKLKYIEEKKRGDELAKLLEKATNSRPEKNTLLEATTTADVEVPKEKTKNVNERVKTSADAPEADAPKSKDTTLKIKIVKNNEEVQLEGNWSQINPALEQIVQLIDKSRADTNRKPSCSDVRSGVSTPDASTIRRVNEIENEIFKEIEEIEKVQIGNDNNDAREDQEIARKRGRPPLKKTAMPIKTNASANDEDKRVDKLEVPTRRSTRTPKSDTSEISNKNSPETKKRLTKNVENTDNSDAYEIRYKFPSPPKETTRRRAPPRARYQIKATRIYSSPENLSVNSDEAQGYIDSDGSPLQIKMSCISSHRPSNYISQTILVPSITEDLSSDNSVSYLTIPLQTKTFTNSSINSNVYRTESYQLLMQKKDAPNYLQKIDELRHSSEQYQYKKTDNIENNNAADQINFENYSADVSEPSQPTSPVLSIVENVSINKSLISNLSRNDIDEPKDPVTLNHLMSQGDCAPLMESDYSVRKRGVDGTKHHYNLQEPSVSDSFLSKMCSVKLEDISQSLNSKIQNLYIESAKKYAKTKTKKTYERKTSAEKQKGQGKGKKTTSTPRKPKATKTKCKPSIFDPCLEEHTESCSQGRRSCPPRICSAQDQQTEPAKPTASKEKPPSSKSKVRVQKNIIKVKITKPYKKITDEPVNETNNAESGIFLQTNDSVDLIHNHSCTCVSAHDCLDDSVQIMDPPQPAVITLDTQSPKPERVRQRFVNDEVDVELMDHDARDGSEVDSAIDYMNSRKTTSTLSSNINTASPNSLITEDLSPHSTPSNWYLVSEEESTNFMEFDRIQTQNVYSSNLEPLFPVTCAVPNLSTITEISRDADTNSKNNDINRPTNP